MNSGAEAEIAALPGARFQQTVEVGCGSLLVAFVANPAASEAIVDIAGVVQAFAEFVEVFDFSTSGTAIA